MLDKNKNFCEKIDEEMPSEKEAQEVLAKYDQDSNMRHFEGIPRQIVKYLCVFFTLGMLVIIIPRIPLALPLHVHRAAFVGMILFLAFILYPANKKNNTRVNYIPWYDIVLAVVGFACFFYYVINFETIVRQMATYTTTDLVVAVVGIAVLAIACYRVMGLPLLVVAGLFLGYTYYGQFIPGDFGHAGFRFERVFTQLFYTDNGIIGIPIGVAATFIFVFMLFSALMLKTGIGVFFMDLATALTGRATGGPAKMVVVVSAMMGMLTGSSVANTVASGSYTIPMMKRMGYEKNFAGAVEASASTGGQIVPPILGAAAFLMAEITGIPYTTIAIAAIIPAVLYFIAIFAAVHFEAKKKNLLGLPANEVPKVLPILLDRGHLLLPIVALIVQLGRGFTPTTSALWAIATLLVVSSIKKDTRLNFQKLTDALELAARNCIAIAVACGIAGIVIGVVSLTGLGHAFIQAMMSFGNIVQHEFWRLILVLIFCMFASLILGLGIPTTAKYVIMAIITAPVLVQMGVPLLAAHMFVFYFGIDADITPPVGLAAYAAAGISKGSPMVTGVIAMRLGIANYIVPFFLIFNPQMLFLEPTFWGVFHAVVVGIICVVAIASGLAGYFFQPMGKIERVLLTLAGIILAGSDFVTSAVAMGVIVVVLIRQILANRATKVIA